jgi:mRNA interferase RelE/StbE
LYRIRSGDYRAVDQIQGDHLRVLIVTVGHRREVYRGH